MNLWRIAVVRAQEQSDSSRTVAEIRWSQDAPTIVYRVCGYPGCGVKLTRGNGKPTRNGYCREHRPK